MEIYYCEKCEGRPYTRKVSSGTRCPVCGSNLRFEDVTEESLTLRKEIVHPAKKTRLRDNVKHEDVKLYRSAFVIPDGEIFYEYLGIEKVGQIDFRCHFILGNLPDENGVINKTPFISPEYNFSGSVEMSELELVRKSFERTVLSSGFIRDDRLYHAFLKIGDETVLKTVTESFADETLSDEERYAEKFFIDYNYQSFGDIKLKPFSQDAGIFNEVKRVLDSRNEKFMEYMYLRVRNGDNMTLTSFADDSSKIFDDPYLALIRYDRVIKESKTMHV